MVLHLIPIVGELSLLNGESVEWRNTQIFPATWPDHSLTHLLSQPDMPLFIFLLISSILNAYRFSGGYRVDMKQAKLINKYETILVPCWYLCCMIRIFFEFWYLDDIIVSDTNLSWMASDPINKLSGSGSWPWSDFYLLSKTIKKV